ncbi:MAG: uroporphyrinogen-III C-methyltransferase [Rhodospirillales bacterium]|jgi:uroporphyrin-III C-methyltransferase|nr:uroporphyrinogen-III C-methyltransferase [Rhodospirillales bacterium]
MTTPKPVYIVGAGPGDPDLMTVKAARLIAEAEVIVFDRLISDEIMALVPAGTTRIFAGKTAKNHHMAQEDINDLLVKLAKAGRSVVRLKGGDPFTFARGSEEALHLAENGIPFEIVPGITAATSVTAYAGIPLTHRGKALGVRFVTGHCQGASNPDLALNWKSLADPDTTLVVYMGLTNLDTLREKLIEAGLPGDTPAAAIQSGTTAQQRTVLTTLAVLPERVREEGLVPPTLMVIGRVAKLSEHLAWFQPGGNVDQEAHG